MESLIQVDNHGITILYHQFSGSVTQINRCMEKRKYLYLLVVNFHLNILLAIRMLECLQLAIQFCIALFTIV